MLAIVQGERRAEMGESGEDIGQEVLDSIINMEEVKRNIQVYCLNITDIFIFVLFKAQNYFSINGQKTLVRITSSGIRIHQHSSRNKLISLKKR